jgi:flagella basal body P-ring formation protein FlgA
MLRDKLILLILVVSIILVGYPIAVSASGLVERELTNFVKQMYSDTDIQMAFSLPQQIKEKTLVKNISFSKIPDISGDGVCLVTVESKNSAETNVYVPFKVLVKKTLFTVKDTVKKGSILKQNDLTVKETFLSGSRTVYPLTIDDVVGKSVKRDMLPGEIVTAQMLENVVMITKGEVVNMTVENKRLIIQAKGIALEKGKMGDTIRLKSSSGKEIVGKVTGGSAVTIQF